MAHAAAFLTGLVLLCTPTSAQSVFRARNLAQQDTVEVNRLKQKYGPKLILDNGPSAQTSKLSNQYIVIMRSEGVSGLDDVSALSASSGLSSKGAFTASTELIDELMGMPSIQSNGESGPAVNRRFTSVIAGFAAALPTQALDYVLKDDRVLLVEQDGDAQTQDEVRTWADEIPWGLDRLDQKAAKLDGKLDSGHYDGSGVDIYVLDTGVNKNHNDYKDQLKGGFDLVKDGKGWEDCNGHGTHTAGLAVGKTYGVATKANLHILRVLKCNGGGKWSTIIGGLDMVAQLAAVSKRPTVASLSLGGPKSRAQDIAVSAAVANGVVMVVAAGNENTDACTKSPASSTAAITVGAINKQDERSDFSNYGSCVDIYAPGSLIRSSWHINKDKTNMNGGTNVISGTSMACPQVAGVAALELQKMVEEGWKPTNADPGARADVSQWSAWPAEVRRRLTANAVAGAIEGTKGGANLIVQVPEDSDGGGGGGGGEAKPCLTLIESYSKGAPCAFPFKYKGVVHTTCTTVDDQARRPWCSTKVDSSGNHVVVGSHWGHCSKDCPIAGQPTPKPTAAPKTPAPTPKATPRATPKPTPKKTTKPTPAPAPAPVFATPVPRVGCKTVSGVDKDKTCVFPFTYDGNTYDSCTNADETNPARIWCATKVHMEEAGARVDGAGPKMGDMVKGKWGFCDTKAKACRATTPPTPAPVPNAPCKTDKGGMCAFPFVYGGLTYTECTTDNDPAGKLWCSTKTNPASNAHVVGNWGHCSDDCKKNAKPTTPPDTTPSPKTPTPKPGSGTTRYPTALPTPRPTQFPTAKPTMRPTPKPLPVQWEMWDELEGSDVTALTASPRYTTPPSKTSYQSALAVRKRSPVAERLRQNSGSRLTTSFTPDESGSFVFHITSDGASELWLSEDGKIGGLWKVASVPSGGECDTGVFTKYPYQTSRAIAMKKGEKYVLRVLHKSGRGGEPHVDVKVTKQAGTSAQSSGGGTGMVSIDAYGSFDNDVAY